METPESRDTAHTPDGVCVALHGRARAFEKEGFVRFIGETQVVSADLNICTCIHTYIYAQLTEVFLRNTLSLQWDNGWELN